MKDQGHGSHWETVLGEESIVAKLKEIVQDSGVLSRKRTKVDFGAGPEEKDVFTLVCPTSEDSPLDFMTLLAENDGYNELVSAYPFVREGALLNGKITDIEIWNNNVEAVVTMEFGEDREINFFATDYNINKEKYQVGAYCDVRLAAFAYECKVRDTKKLSFQLEGDAAKNFRAKLGKEIREKFGEDEHDESPISFDTSEMTMLLPISEDYRDDYQFLSPVQYVSPFGVLGVRMLQVGIFVDDVDAALVEEISKLEPFGMANPSPSFVVKNLVLKQKKLMGATKEHLKLTVETNNRTIDCVWWSRGDIPLIAGDRLDIAFAPQLNTFNGVTSVQLVLKDIHSDALNEEEISKTKIYDHRKKTNILAQVNDYIKNSKLKICVFVEDKNILESIKPFESIAKCISKRDNVQKSDVLMFFDYPADEDIMQRVMTTVSPDVIHYMNYPKGKYNEELILKLFSGMLRYTCNTLDGDFNIERAASALGVTNDIVEVLLEMFEDAGMIKILQRYDECFKIGFISSVELSKTLHTIKYAEFIELMNTVNDYKHKFMTMNLEKM